MPNNIGPLAAMQYVQAQGDRGAVQGREQFTQRTAGQIIQGDPAAYGKLAAVDPAAAKAAQGAGDAQVLRMEGLINYMKGIEAQNPAAAQAAWVAHGVPYVRQFANGTEPTQDWNQAKTMLATLEGRIAMAKAGHEGDQMPTGFQEAHMSAVAAGYQPGSPEYQRVMRIKTGVEGRAATGGFGFEKVTGADGRERLARKNPRTGVVEIYDESTGDFVPMGGGAGLNPGAPTPQAAPAQMVAGEVPFSIDPSLPPEVQAAIRANPQGAAAIQDGGTLPITPNAGAVTVSNPAQTAQAPRGANPALGVSRAPEEQAALTTAAQEAAKLPYLSEAERIKAEAGTAGALATEAGKVDIQKRSDALAALPTIRANADEAIGLIDKVLAHPGKKMATGATSMLQTTRIPGTPAYDFKTLLDQVKGKAFLQAFQSLKGAGAITEQEGAKATAAMGRLDTAQTEEAFDEAMRELQGVIRLGKQIAEQKAAGGSPNAGGSGGNATPAPAPAAGNYSSLWGD